MFRGKAELQRVPSKNNIWENEASGVARFSDSFLGFVCVPLSVWQQVNVQWLRGVMMLFKGKHCAIMRMDFIQQIGAANFCDMDTIPKLWLPFQSHSTSQGSQKGLSTS